MAGGAVVRIGPLASMRPAHQAREVGISGGGTVGVGEASMRPAHQAREVFGQHHRLGDCRAASMRPAHQAREVLRLSDMMKIESEASMRPAHQAREVPSDWADRHGKGACFNEARASSTGSTAAAKAGGRR